LGTDMTATESPISGDLAPTDIAALLRGYELSLRARNRSPRTITSYLQTVEIFRAFLVEAGMPTVVDRLTRGHVEAFISDQLSRWRPKTAHVRYGDLRQFFNWCVDEGEAPAHPMDRMKPPALPEVPVPVVSDSDLRKLLKACEGKDFDNRRDLALLRVMIDCGLRLAEVTQLRVDDIDFDLQVVVVLGKGKGPDLYPLARTPAKRSSATCGCAHVI